MSDIGTDFTDIYSLNSIIKDDYRLNTKTTNQIYALYFLYLQYSISYFQNACMKDLTNYIPFSQQEYYFTCENSDNQYSLIPSPLSGCEFYVGFRASSDLAYTQTFDFTFNSSTNILTISNNPISGYEVYISGFIIGSFNDTLDLIEKRILSEGMNVPFDNEQVQRQSLLNMMVYSGESKMYSQANHIKEVKDVAINQYWKILRSMINDYSYSSQSSLDGLGGGLT